LTSIPMAQLSIWMKLSTNNSKSHKLQVTSHKSQGRRLTTGVFVSLCLCALALLGMAKPLKAKVYIQKLKNGHYRLIADRKPFIVKGVCYNPVPIGQNHENDWWSDPNKPWLEDGRLMKAMGVNTIRLYQSHENPDEVRQVIRDFYQLYGIRTILGDWLGFWEYPCPLYGNKDFMDRIKNQVLDMVRLYKDEPGILMWILGNENNYSFLGQ
jgi:hypothetical protein